MENRGILERVLNDCKGHAAAVEADFHRSTGNTEQPSSISPGFLQSYLIMGFFVGTIFMTIRKLGLDGS